MAAMTTNSNRKHNAHTQQPKKERQRHENKFQRPMEQMKENDEERLPSLKKGSIHSDGKESRPTYAVISTRN